MWTHIDVPCFPPHGIDVGSPEVHAWDEDGSSKGRGKHSSWNAAEIICRSPTQQGEGYCSPPGYHPRIVCMFVRLGSICANESSGKDELGAEETGLCDGVYDAAEARGGASGEQVDRGEQPSTEEGGEESGYDALYQELHTLGWEHDQPMWYRESVRRWCLQRSILPRAHSQS